MDGRVKKDEETDDEDPQASAFNPEDGDIRDVRYFLELLGWVPLRLWPILRRDLSLKERNLVVKQVTWVFAPDSRQKVPTLVHACSAPRTQSMGSVKGQSQDSALSHGTR